jgi:hypothetical protein
MRTVLRIRRGRRPTVSLRMPEAEEANSWTEPVTTAARCGLKEPKLDWKMGTA